MNEHRTKGPSLINKIVGACEMAFDVLILVVLDHELNDIREFSVRAYSFGCFALFTAGQHSADLFRCKEVPVIEGMDVTQP